MSEIFIISSETIIKSICPKSKSSFRSEISLIENRVKIKNNEKYKMYVLGKG